MKQKNKKSGFFTILLGALNASLLGNLLTDKGVMRAGEGGAVMSQGRLEQDRTLNEIIIHTMQSSKSKLLMKHTMTLIKMIIRKVLNLRLAII